MTATDVLFIGVTIFTLAVGLLIIAFVGNTMSSAVGNSAAFNSSPDAKSAMQTGIHKVTDKTDYIVFSVFIGMVFALIISSWYIAGNPIFFFIYFIVIILGVVFGAILSNVWEVLSTKPTFSALLPLLPKTNHILTYLPFYIAAIGCLGIIIMFAKPGPSGAGEGQGGL